MTALTKNEETVLRWLYEQKDADTPPTSDDIAAATGLSASLVREVTESFVEKDMISGPQSLLKRVMDGLAEMDEKFKPTDAGYAEHIILLASAFEKADEVFLARELGYELEFVSLVGSRLRSSGVWKDSEVEEGHFETWKKDGVGFYCDGAVATGDLVIVGHGKNGPEYKMTEGGSSRAAKLFKK